MRLKQHQCAAILAIGGFHWLPPKRGELPRGSFLQLRLEPNPDEDGRDEAQEVYGGRTLGC